MSRSILIAPAALVAAPFAALLSSVPAAARVADPRIAFLAAWPVIAGVVAVPLAAFIAALRLARRSLDDRAPSAAAALLWGSAVWLAVSIPADAVLVAVLKATTHHRALGGVTFAVFGLVANALAVLAAWRFTSSVLPRLSAPSRKKEFALVVVLGAGAFVLFVVVVSGLVAGGPADASLVDRILALLVDGTLAVAATSLAAMWDVPLKRSNVATWSGAGGLALLAAVSLSSLLQSPTLAHRLVEQAPFAAAVGQTVGLGSDAVSGGPAPASPPPASSSRTH